MKVLVTGGMGYLGRVVTQELTKKAFDVRVFDSLMYGNEGMHSDFEFIKGDIRDEPALRQALDQVDAVVHLAAIVGESAANVDIETTLNVNYLATRRLAEICGKTSRRLLFASTCSLYGGRPGLLLNETSEVYPLSPYAMTKLAAEESIAKLNGQRSTIIRLGTCFGFSPRMRFDLVINRFVGQAMQDGKITVFGGTQCRPFLHVRDAASAMVNAVTADRTGTYNVAGFNCNIRGVAEIIQRMVNCELIVLDKRGDPRDYTVDSSLAVRTFRIEFTRSVEDCVKEIGDAFRDGVIADYKQIHYHNEEYLKRSITTK